MKGYMNTPYTLCKAIVIAAFAVFAVACILGCRATGNATAAGVKEQVGTVLLIAYENGGKEAVSNRIDQLVAEGKLTAEQATRLQTLVDIACERLIADLVQGEVGGGLNATTNAAPAKGSVDLAPSGASTDGGGGTTGGAEGAASS